MTAPPAPDARRMIDVAVSGVALVLLFPLLLAIGSAIAVRMGRPVLFAQNRAGLHGEAFTIYKFRTMRAERYPGEPDPDRLTRLGRLLRTASLDELPQLYNVLRGDMSLVGPRPTLPEQVVHYSERQRGRLAVRPGLTGYAQVVARNSIDWPSRIELDLAYIARRSWRVDTWILSRTVQQLFQPRGITAEGGINPGFPAPDSDSGAGTPLCGTGH